MYERFTDRARKVMKLANQEAHRFNHQYIASEHILLGLIREGAGVAANVLRNLGIDLGRIQLEVEKAVQSETIKLATGKLPLVPRAKRIIEDSINEAHNLGHNYVGTEHLLLGLMREENGLATRVIAGKGLTLEQVRAEIRELLADNSKPDGPQPVEQVARWTDRAVPELPGKHGDQTDRAGVLPESTAEYVNYERFTDRARKVMQLANQEAQRFKHEYIGTLHILLGLVMEGEGVAAHMLKNVGLDLRKIRLEVETIVQPGPCILYMGKLPMTPRAKWLIKGSIEEARSLNHNYVGTEHLLLGLLRDQDSVAGQIFMNLGLNTDQLRERVLKLLGNNMAAPVNNDDPAWRNKLLAVHQVVEECNRLEAGKQPEQERLNPTSPRTKSSIEVDDRIRALERQLATVRFLLGAILGAGAGIPTGDRIGVLAGLLVGGGVALFGRLIPAILVGGFAGVYVGSTQFGDQAATVAGAVGGALIAACVVEVGGPVRTGKTDGSA
jgi:ATP-dependent Clp protease ATP-binding subunit ClpA